MFKQYATGELARLAIINKAYELAVCPTNTAFGNLDFLKLLYFCKPKQSAFGNTK